VNPVILHQGGHNIISDRVATPANFEKIFKENSIFDLL